MGEIRRHTSRKTDEPALLPVRTWQQDAACTDYPVTWWFPPPTKEGRQNRRKARYICNDCPVQKQCLDEAYAIGETDGMRAGMMPDEWLKLVLGVDKVKSA